MSYLKKPPSGPAERILVLLLVLFALLPLRVGAAERLRVQPGLEVRQEYDTNVFNWDRDERDDLVTRVTPTLQLRSDGDLGHTRLTGGLRSRTYLDNRDLNAVDKFFDWDVERKLTPRLSVQTDGTFTFREKLQEVTDGDLVLSGTSPDQKHQRLIAAMSYALSPVSSVSASVGYNERDWDSEPGDDDNYRRDRQTTYGQLAYARSVTPRDQLQASLYLGESHFDAAATGEEDNRLLAPQLAWTRAWSPKLSSSVQAGVRFLEIDRELSQSDDSTGFVGGVSLSREFPNGTLELSFQQETRPSSGLGTSLDQQTLRARYDGKLTQRLGFELSGSYQTYESAGDSLALVEDLTQCQASDLAVVWNGRLVCVRDTSNEVNSAVYGLRARLNWRMRKHLYTFISYDFRKQTADGTASYRDYDGHRIMLGFQSSHPVDLN